MLERFRKRAVYLLRKMNPPQIIVLMFLAVILTGASILTLPASSAAGTPTDFLTCLFTATSATCVTGLSVVETGLHWSIFGQWMILLMIQIGGLGFMSIACVFYIVLRRRIGLKKRMILAQALSLDSMNGVVRMVRNVVLGTLAVELCGAALLTACFLRRFPFWKALRFGIFHAVSAYCNAGFDILADVDAGGSLSFYAADPAVNLIIIALITIGGLGFLVWGELRRTRRFSRLSVYTRLVLILSAVLTFGGAALLAVLEWNNPWTLGGMPVWQKLLASLFQSVTTRTAGFFTVSQAGLTEAGKAVSDMLMFVGGSSGSTAGGLKTVTAAVLALSAVSALRGRTSVTAFGRTIEPRSIMNAVALTVIGVTISLGGACVIAFIENVPMNLCLYETASAFGTVGLTMSLTPALSALSHIMLIVMMYFGRVGVLTLGVAVFLRRREPPKLKFPSGNVMIG